MEGFFGIGIQELILIAIVALIVLGPERLPATFREIAKFVRYVRNLTNEFTSQFGDDFKALEDLDPRRMLQREIESIDAEENKGKPAATKPATTTTKPATATTAKTTTPVKPAATTPKPTTTATTTTTAKSTSNTSSTGKPAITQPAPSTTTTESSSTAAPAAAAASSTVDTSATTVVTTPESDNRIAPPSVTPPVTEQSSTPVTTVAYSGSTNGVAAKDVEATVADHAATNGTVPTNGTQAPSTAQSE